MTQDTATTDNKQVLERNRTALNARDMDAYLNNQIPDVTITFSGGAIHGREQLKQFTEAMWATFPDGQLTFVAQAFNDDMAFTEVVFTGTQTGPMVTPNGTIPPTGKRVTTHSVSVLKIKDGKIVSEHVYSDPLEMMTQLGLAPSAPADNN